MGRERYEMELRDVIGKLVRPWTLFRQSTGRFVEVVEGAHGWEDEEEYDRGRMVSLVDPDDPGSTLEMQSSIGEFDSNTCTSIGRTS